MTMSYGSFLSNQILFHPVCTSLFVTQPWIQSLFIENANSYGTGDFRTTAHAQVTQLVYIEQFKDNLYQRIFEWKINYPCRYNRSKTDG